MDGQDLRRLKDHTRAVQRCTLGDLVEACRDSYC